VHGSGVSFQPQLAQRRGTVAPERAIVLFARSMSDANHKPIPLVEHALVSVRLGHPKTTADPRPISRLRVP